MEDRNTLRVLLEALQNGEIGLNDRRTRMLNRVPEQGNWAAYRESLEPVDLVWLVAKTDNCFSILRGNGCDILFHGDGADCTYDGLLYDLLQKDKLRLIAKCRPGVLEPETVL